MVISWGRSADRAEAAPAAETIDRMALFDDAFATAGMGYWIYNADSGAFKSGGALCDIYLKAFASVARPDSLQRALLGEDDSNAELKRAWNAIWTKEALFDREHRIERMDGSAIWARMIAFSSFNAEGELARVSGMVIDTDPYKKGDDDIRAALNRAETASQRKSDFVATLSHEIRTPLNGVIGMAQLLSASDLDETQRSHLDTLMGASRSLMAMLDDSLDLAKIEAGEAELHCEPLNIEALLRDVVATAGPMAEQKGLEFDLEVAPECAAEAEGDRDRLRQVLSNLVFNALKFTDQGSVKIAVEPRPDGKTRFEVRDTGRGVPEDEREAIFERFHQGPSERRAPQGGVGLGLSICRTLVAQMGGDIGVESRRGQGATFWFELPLGGAPAGTAGSAGKTPDEYDEGVDGVTRILIAEDDPTNQKVFAAALATTGYQLDFAENGLEAIEKLKAARFDLVIMDINMPVMSGEEAIAQIRASEAPWRDVPIVVVTALTNRDSRRYYCNLGATDYLPKPIDIAALVKKTANLVGAAAMA